jgi:2',3'-cyclic-nucleotide 2'-phosphodiesterase (5'-nucleotidase family)
MHHFSLVFLAASLLFQAQLALSFKDCLQPVRQKIYDPACPQAKVPKTLLQDHEACTNPNAEEPSSTAASNDVCAFVTEAIFADIPVFDVALFNNGMCNTDIHEGVFTPKDAMKVLPYNNELIGLSIEGTVLVYAIEHGIQESLEGNFGAYPKTAGIKYKVDYTQPFGNRVSDVEILSHYCIWTPIQKQENYSVLTNSYLANGGDGYTFLKKMTRTTTRTGVSEVDSFWFHAQSTCIIESPWKKQQDFDTEAAKNTKVVYQVGEISNHNRTLTSAY